MANRMTNLVDKIERRLGTKPLGLPKDICKDRWVEDCIIPDTLETFSRYFPHIVRIKIDTKHKKGDYYLIDQDFINGEEIIGIRDVAFDEYGSDSLYIQQAAGLGVYDYMSTSTSYSMDDVMLLQGRADLVSVFNNQIYVDFKEPNLVKLVNVTGSDISNSLGYIPLDVFIKHPSNLMTIPVTQMETFEALAIADVASYLVAYLRHWEGLETVFANVELKLENLEKYADRRDDIIQTIKDGYVNPANKNQPIMFTV